jgi:predicted nucleic acid-binding protein
LINIGQARKFLFDILQAPAILHAYEPLLFRATDISSRYRAGLYDCLYVALGEREICEVITADQRMLRNLQAHFPFVRDIAWLP